MENNYEVKYVSPKMDHDAEALVESQSESTLTSSRCDADSNLDECDGWTNEKHNSYLDSLESSFVTQLYSLLGREETRRMSRSTRRHVLSNSHKSTHQFTVLQNGCQQKVNFGKKRAYLEMSSEYTTGTAEQGNVLCKEEIGDKAFTYPAQCTAEASGQNFRQVVEEKGCNSGVFRKRRREASYDESSQNDQVVP